MTGRKIALAAVLACAAALPAAAQDINARANYGELTLESGFTPDPRVISLRAGGDRNAQNLSSSCRGFVTNTPDVRLHYDAGSLPLFISAWSDADTTLIVNAPDGSYYCSDDANGLNPAVQFNRPMSGRYEIWVGTYSSGSTEPAQLRISEIGSSD